MTLEAKSKRARRGGGGSVCAMCREGWGLLGGCVGVSWLRAPRSSHRPRCDTGMQNSQNCCASMIQCAINSILDISACSNERGIIFCKIKLMIIFEPKSHPD